MSRNSWTKAVSCLPPPHPPRWDLSQEIANRAEFPGLVAYSSPSNYRPPQHIYGQMPDYGDDWTAFANYYMKNIWKGTGKPKMALHLLNNPTGAGAKDAAKALADKLGIEIVATEEHATTTISEMESLTRIKANESRCAVYLQHAGTDGGHHQECRGTGHVSRYDHRCLVMPA